MSDRKRTRALVPVAMEIPDAHLVYRFQGGDTAALDRLLSRYERKIIAIAGEFTIPGLDRDDKVAEARFGFLKAARDWQEDGGSNFKNYAKVIIQRVLIERYRSANARGAVPFTALLSIDVPVEPASGGNAMTLEEILGDGSDVGLEFECRDAAEEAIARLLDEQESRVADESDFGYRVRDAFLSYVAMRVTDHRVRYSMERVVNPIGQPKLDLYDRLEPEAERRTFHELFECFQALAIRCISALAEGYQPSEIAGQERIPVELAMKVLAACRLGSSDRFNDRTEEV